MNYNGLWGEVGHFWGMAVWLYGGMVGGLLTRIEERKSVNFVFLQSLIQMIYPIQ
jgi:hypothetical protein